MPASVGESHSAPSEAAVRKARGPRQLPGEGRALPLVHRASRPRPARRLAPPLEPVSQERLGFRTCNGEYVDERNRPDPRLIRRPRCRVRGGGVAPLLGLLDAHTHGPGADGGIDVESKEVVAQVKARVSTAGRPELQQLYGAAAGAGRRAVFFSLGGYTSQAIGWANEVGIALFEFDLQGEPEPMNEPAATVWTRSLGAAPSCRPGNHDRLRQLDSDVGVSGVPTIASAP